MTSPYLDQSRPTRKLIEELGGRARSPRRSAAPDRRPRYGRAKPYRFV